MDTTRSANCRRACIASLAAAALLGGCASIPDITVSYRPVKWSVLATVAHTITCNRDSQLAVVERGATFLPIYSAAKADDRFQIQLKDLDRFYADADVALTFTDDGRLKTINQSTTGQGESAIKTAIGALATLSAASVAEVKSSAEDVQVFNDRTFSHRVDKSQPSDVCKVVLDWSLRAPGQLPQVSLVQSATVSGPTVGDGIDAKPSDDQKDLLASLKAVGLDLTAKVKAGLSMDEQQPIAKPRGTVAGDEVALTLQRVGVLRLEAKDAQGDVDARSIPVPLAETFVLPIPKAALFGKQSFSLALAESGKITSIGYGRTTGVPAALGALTAVAGAEITEDNARAASLKAASDLIAQQQRYTNCRLKSADCK